MAFLSIVSPVYNTGSALEEMIRRLTIVLDTVREGYEIILVDDGSKDSSWQIMVDLSNRYSYVKAVKLSRNFGQHAAITAGLELAKGDWIVVMDSDLQDMPESIPQLYKRANEEYDIVVAKRRSRTDNFYRRFVSRLFYFLLDRLSGISTDYMVANFGIYNRKVIDEIIAMKETHRFFPMMVNWTGFNKTTIECEHGQRKGGKSGYDFKKLLQLALNTAISYSDKPLRYVVKIGLLISVISFLLGIIVLVRYFMGKISVLGYTSLVLSVWFLGGLILFTLGIVGLYVGKTFEEVKKRPLYIIEKMHNN